MKEKEYLQEYDPTSPIKAVKKAVQEIEQVCNKDKVIAEVQFSLAAWNNILGYHNLCPNIDINRIALNTLRDCDRIQYDNIIGKYFQKARISLLNPEVYLNSNIRCITFAPDDEEINYEYYD